MWSRGGWCSISLRTSTHNRQSPLKNCLLFGVVFVYWACVSCVCACMWGYHVLPAKLPAFLGSKSKQKLIRLSKRRKKKKTSVDWQAVQPPSPSPPPALPSSSISFFLSPFVLPYYSIYGNHNIEDEARRLFSARLFYSFSLHWPVASPISQYCRLWWQPRQQ